MFWWLAQDIAWLCFSVAESGIILNLSLFSKCFFLMKVCLGIQRPYFLQKVKLIASSSLSQCSSDNYFSTCRQELYFWKFLNAPPPSSLQELNLQSFPCTEPSCHIPTFRGSVQPHTWPYNSISSAASFLGFFSGRGSFSMACWIAAK